MPDPTQALAGLADDIDDVPTGGALISDCGRYRYRLWRQWDHRAPRMRFVMLNPSTADAEKDDATITRCIGFAKREGLGGIEVVNLFALRVTRPVHLFDRTIADDPEGPENLQMVMDVLGFVLWTQLAPVAAWGAFPGATKSAAYSYLRNHPRVQCLGKTASGAPRHPLYLPADQPLEVWP